ncbi:ankyrin repeat domain-containing protein [Streptomyces sp. Pv4-95]|uniref:ankyrin repeat domain-containing protein n=1 Tax=Streptomyces sp. Pv4-95 TaxID=3049543 RepID=UPI003891CCD5
MANALTGQLIEAIYEEAPERVAELLRQGASPSAADADGEKPLYVAAVSGAADIVRLLLEAGASPDEESRGQPGSEGLPLCAAACWGHTEAVRELLAHGADPNRREDDGTGWAPLLWAAAGGRHDTAHLLLGANADPDAGCGDRTPLMAAAEFGATGIVRELLHHGADAHRTDSQGRTALDMAGEWCGKDIESELRNRANIGPDDTYECLRVPRPDGNELIEFIVTAKSGGGASWEKETGHAEIADLLRERMSR